MSVANQRGNGSGGMPRGLWLTYLLIGTLAAIIVPLGLLATVLAMIETDPEGAAGGAIAAIIVFTGWLGLFLFLIRWIGRSRPRRFNPQTDDPLDDWRPHP